MWLGLEPSPSQTRNHGTIDSKPQAASGQDGRWRQQLPECSKEGLSYSGPVPTARRTGAKDFELQPQESVLLCPLPYLCRLHVSLGRVYAPPVLCPSHPSFHILPASLPTHVPEHYSAACGAGLAGQVTPATVEPLAHLSHSTLPPHTAPTAKVPDSKGFTLVNSFCQVLWPGPRPGRSGGFYVYRRGSDPLLWAEETQTESSLQND